MTNLSAPDYHARISSLRRILSSLNLSALILRGTDRFLNEYVPDDESSRIWLSGFTGSAGDILLTLAEAFLFVDGRYHLQADQQLDPELFQAVKVPLGTSLEKAIQGKIRELFSGQPARIGLEPEKFSVDGMIRFRKAVEDLKIEFVPLNPSPMDQAMPAAHEKIGEIRMIPDEMAGGTTDSKLETIRQFMASRTVSLWVVQPLDEIAWLTNLRGDELPFQATFKSFCLVTQSSLYLFLPKPERLKRFQLSGITAVPLSHLEKTISDFSKEQSAGYDPSETTELVRMSLESSGIRTKAMSSPLPALKAKKTAGELEQMIGSFERADRVVARAKSWLCRKISAGDKVTEADFTSKVGWLFRQSGATGLSFQVIGAAGRNGAVIHYSNPDPRRIIRSGELVLLDTGAYYEGGYATDLTRTFLAGEAGLKGSEKQKEIYTLVLKGAIAGMSAVFPSGTNGAAIDALVRAPLWKGGYDYNHGTGHGVGINVHESPPRISVAGHPVLEKGHVFSIEPGIYLPDFGGVRLENLCTIVDHPSLSGWYCVVPLTFSPFDKRLIDLSLLTRGEKNWLRWYNTMGKFSRTRPPEPFLPID